MEQEENMEGIEKNLINLLSQPIETILDGIRRICLFRRKFPKMMPAKHLRQKILFRRTRLLKNACKIVLQAVNDDENSKLG